MSIHVPRWRAPLDSASKFALPSGKTSPRFASQRFGSSFHENLREWFRPIPPRIPVSRESWKNDPAYRPSQAIALAVHAGVLILILFPLRHLPGSTEHSATKSYVVPLDISEFPFNSPAGKDEASGGGGGGDRSSISASKGRLPKFMTTQFAPPSIPRNEKPILVAEASLIGPPDLQFPSPNLNMDGNPFAKMVNDSNGPGNGGGMGDGEGAGMGSGHGPGFGPGGNGGWGGGDVFRPGSKGVGFPSCIYCPDAKYPEEARKAKFQGVVQLQVIVLPDGRATDIQVIRGPGLGLDEQAVAAVKTWRFKPALGPNRVPVPTQIIIEVQFRLL
jgi:periplasmic protein TonB